MSKTIAEPPEKEQKMTDTLDYKILKYLKKNDNGEYFDLTFLENNKNLLDSKIKELTKRKLISEKKTTVIGDGYSTSKVVGHKILIDGIKYVNECESKVITSKIEDLTLKKLQFEQIPSKFWWLIIIIMAFISVITNWVNNQISKSENQEMQQEQQKSERK